MSETRKIWGLQHLSLDRIFAFLLMLPIVLGMINLLLGFEIFPGAVGYACLPVLGLMIAAFVANFNACSTTSLQITRRQKSAEAALTHIEDNPEFIILIELPDKAETRIVADQGCFKIDDGEAMSREGILEHLLSISTARWCIRSR